MARNYHIKKIESSRKEREAARQARRTFKQGLDFIMNPDGSITRIYKNKIDQGDYQYRIRECQDSIPYDDTISIARNHEK